MGTTPPEARTQAVLMQAWDSFDGNVAIQSDGQAAVACHKGCPSCCTLRVSALTPEVFMIAAYLQAALRQRGLAWGSHELNHALILALDNSRAQANWLEGGDPLADSAIDLDYRSAMAAGFDDVAH